MSSEGLLVHKTGKGDQGRDPDYPGGVVWRSLSEASAHAAIGYETYAVVLPMSWDQSTHEVDGQHHLLVDAAIIPNLPW